MHNCVEQLQSIIMGMMNHARTYKITIINNARVDTRAFVEVNVLSAISGDRDRTSDPTDMSRML